MTDAARTLTVLHKANGQFAEGNPGRPRGSKNQISNVALAAVKDMKDDAIQQLRTKLERGDWDAIVFVLERILPRGRSVELYGTSPGDVAAMLQSGELTTGEAKDVATALRRLREIEDLDQFRQRLDELEKMIGDGARK